MKGVVPFAALLAFLLLGPLLLYRNAGRASGRAEDTIVIITPHNEATRYEFARAFSAAHLAKTGRALFVDWRAVGGTSEIVCYVNAQYLGSFRDYWTRVLRRAWTPECASFDDPKAATPGAIAARKAFLASDAGCGVDLFFGGGSFDYIQMAAAGRLVDSGVIAAHPELYPGTRISEEDGTSGGWAGGEPRVASTIQQISSAPPATLIPQTLSGEPLWDPGGRWLGACLSAFGICYNTDSLARLGILQPPAQWSDLADPLYANELALADPTQSGSVAKAFEMIIQQQISRERHSPRRRRGSVEVGGRASPEWPSQSHQIPQPGLTLPSAKPSPASPEGPSASPQQIAAGWLHAMQLIQRISANARYFTDSATQIPYSVQAGDAAAGMCIDFYGRFESEAVRRPDGSSRLLYITPQGGSSTGADSIGLFRGAPHAALAREFIQFVISPEGQKLWCFRAGTPGGPEKYPLRRLPIRPDLYAAQWRQYEADPDVAPYTRQSGFVYHPQWTGSLFGVISFAIRTAFIDPHDELKQAWQALIAARFPPQATAAFSDLSAIDYTQASGPIRDALRSSNKLDSVQMARALDEHFRAQYARAESLARRGL